MPLCGGGGATLGRGKRMRFFVSRLCVHTARMLNNVLRQITSQSQEQYMCIFFDTQINSIGQRQRLEGKCLLWLSNLHSVQHIRGSHKGKGRVRIKKRSFDRNQNKGRPKSGICIYTVVYPDVDIRYGEYFDKALFSQLNCRLMVFAELICLMLDILVCTQLRTILFFFSFFFLLLYLHTVCFSLYVKEISASVCLDQDGKCAFVT